MKKNRFGDLDELLFVFKPKKDFEIQEEVSLTKGGCFILYLIGMRKTHRAHRVGGAGRCSNYTFNSKGLGNGSTLATKWKTERESVVSPKALREPWVSPPVETGWLSGQLQKK